MQAILDPPTSVTTVSASDAQRAAHTYVAAHIDPLFEVVSGTRFHSKASGREVWQFVIRCPHGPLDAIEVDAETGTVIPLPEDKRRAICEKAAIYTARHRGALPTDAQGYMLGEYARRRASRYLGDLLSMYYDGADPLFVPGDPPVWQVTIIFKMYDVGPFTLGVLDVDAKTGEPLAIPSEQIERIRERTRAIVRAQTPATTTS
jgi:hypothetical protein